MNEPFADILIVGGKSNSLGRVNEVIELVLRDPARLNELYDCLFVDDAWARMRAADALEKVCRVHPEWLLPFIDRFAAELADNRQPSIQWHLAQIYSEVTLTPDQKRFAIRWLAGLVSTTDVDWIVAANAMKTLHQFVQDGSYPAGKLVPLLNIQLHHKSNAVIRRAGKILQALR